MGVNHAIAYWKTWDFPTFKTLIIKQLFLSCLIFFPGLLLSQNPENRASAPDQTVEWITRMDTVISLRLNFNNEYDRFLLRGIDQSYDIRPTVLISNRISVNYRFISLGAGWTMRFLPWNQGSERKGSTEAFYLRFNLFTTFIQQELQYGRITGFYLHNTEELIDDWNLHVDPYHQMPGLRVDMISGATMFKFNRRFSIKALSSQTEIQRKSCGSFIPSLSYSFYRIENSDEEQPSELRQLSSTLNILLNPGYFYTFVLNRRFYIGGGITPGIGFSYTHLDKLSAGDNSIETISSVVYRLQERVGFGYNSRRLFAGASASLTQWFHYADAGKPELNAIKNFYEVFVGYRFRAPGFVRKNTMKIEQQLPILAPQPLPD